MSVTGRILVYGGKGALGSVIVSTFKSKNYWVGSLDLVPNELADGNVIVKPGDSWTEQEEEIAKLVEGMLGENKLDAVLCVAGGWAGGNASSKAYIKNCDMMWKQSVWSSSIAGSLAAKHLKEGGLLTLPGAMPALKGTPGMIGYGMAKAAIHQLVQSLASEGGGLPNNASALAILPLWVALCMYLKAREFKHVDKSVTLDTPMNRKWMSEADHTTWTSLEFVADLFVKWTSGEGRPANGSLVQLITKDSKTELVMS